MSTLIVGPYTIKEEEDRVLISVEMPWGTDTFKYYLQRKENCEPEQTKQNRDATNVYKFINPLLGRYKELWYTNKEKPYKESRLMGLIFA